MRLGTWVFPLWLVLLPRARSLLRFEVGLAGPAWHERCPVRLCPPPLSETPRPRCHSHATLGLPPQVPNARAAATPPPAGVVMVFSTSAFGTYFKLTQDGPSNSSHVHLLAPVSVEPTDASVGLAWLAVGSVCLFIAGEEARGEAEWGLMGLPCRCQVPAASSASRLTWLTSASVPLTRCQAPSYALLCSVHSPRTTTLQAGPIFVPFYRAKG